MPRISFFVVVTIALLLDSPHTACAEDCQIPSFSSQKQDEETIHRLEEGWQGARVSGDTNFERCLLERGFVEILKDGSIKDLEYELKLSAMDKDKTVPHRPFSEVSVLLHGNIAMAYGRLVSNMHDLKSDNIPFADYFLWDGALWHVFFAQQTSSEPNVADGLDQSSSRSANSLSRFY